MKPVKIGNKHVGPGQPCYVIAEIGINHNGDVDIAKRLISVAVAAGCDAVKFQKRTIDVVYTAKNCRRPRENPFGPTNGDLSVGLSFEAEEYAEISDFCKSIKIPWFASPWDEGAVDFMEQFNIPVYKIASLAHRRPSPSTHSQDRQAGNRFDRHEHLRRDRPCRRRPRPGNLRPDAYHQHLYSRVQAMEPPVPSRQWPSAMVSQSATPATKLASPPRSPPVPSVPAVLSAISRWTAQCGVQTKPHRWSPTESAVWCGTSVSSNSQWVTASNASMRKRFLS